MCNGPAFDSAIRLLQRYPDLEVGIHLTLNEGRPLLSPGLVPNLVDRNGDFYNSLVDLLSLWYRGKLDPAEVFSEWKAQIERAKLAGIEISHLDSHKHVHIFPPLAGVIIELARQYDIPYVRLPLERDLLYLLKRVPGSFGLLGLAWRARKLFRDSGINFAENFYGIGLSGGMTYAHLVRIIRAPHAGVTEIMLHPAKITPQVASLQHRYAWAARYKFEEELDALIKVKPFLHQDYRSSYISSG